MSGQHVVYGFLRPFAQWFCPQHKLTVLHYESELPPKDLLSCHGVTAVCLSDRLKHWTKRSLWETLMFPAVVRRENTDLVLNVSGSMSPRCPVPQVVLCQNPWCYVPSAQRGWREHLKARLQRIGYKSAYRDAAMMIYISRHLRDLYRNANPGVNETRSEIAYVGINESTFRNADALKGTAREPNTILSVSAMARWKGASTLVQAMRLLVDRGIHAKLKLVGPWPDPDYEQQIRMQVTELDLSSYVHILGKVNDIELHRLYATSRVFCLMSSCESYGIPAAEAMAFGTPIVSTDCCAIAEICAGAGQFGPVNDPLWTARALQAALTDDSNWQLWSSQAIRNAGELTWEKCTRPFQQLLQILDHVV